MKKFLTMALALMMVLSLFAVPTMAATGHYLGADLLGGKGSFEALEPGSTITNNATDGFAAYDGTITATVVNDKAVSGNAVRLTPAHDGRSPSMYITRDTEIAEGSGIYYLPVTAGQRYLISFDAWHNATTLEATGAWNTQLHIDNYFFDANGTQVQRLYDGFSASAYTAGKWSHFEQMIVVPAGAVYMRSLLALPKANGELWVDNVTIRTTDEIIPTPHTISEVLGSFESFSPNSTYAATGNRSLSGVSLGSTVYKGTDAVGVIGLYNSTDVPGVAAQHGEMFIGLGVKSELDPAHTTVNCQNALSFASANTGTTVLLDYGKTYEISVWFNAANAADSYTGEEGDKPMVPVLIVNSTGTSQQARGTEKMAFYDAWKVDGWQKLTWEFTVPEKSYYDGLTASGKKIGAVDVGIACYSSAGTMGYFDNFSVVEKKTVTPPAPTTAAVTITGANAAVSVAADTVAIGEGTTFTAKPAFGYYIDSITIGGEDFVGFDAYKGGTYETGALAADTEIVVTTASYAANDKGVATEVATLPEAFAEADTAVTFGKVLDDANATSWGIELTKDGVGVTPYHGGSYLYKANATNANGQYAIEFIGLEAGTYQIRSYMYIDGTPVFGAPATFVVD